jgi:hypothetical protein
MYWHLFIIVKAVNEHTLICFKTRQYGKHKSTYERNGVLFSRIISTVKTPLGQRGRYAVVQYILKKKL